MKKNPYSVLGVPENATDEEIKKAYRALVKKYHPDKYSDSDLAELANEKMQEINAAYDEIEQLRKSGSSYSGSSAYTDFSHSGSNSGYAAVRQYINARNYAAAYNNLNAVPVADRGAEWNFLMGCTLMGMGRLFDARNYFETACNMDPSNLEYRAARDRASSVSFGGNYNTTGTGSGCGCSSCDVCSSLICADCLCECCGGDLISCC